MAKQAKDYLKANEDLIRGDRTDMIDLYKDVVMEQICVNGAPAGSPTSTRRSSPDEDRT